MADITSHRWKREVPINLCLLYLSYLPLKFALFEKKSEYAIDPFGLDSYHEPPIGRYFSIHSLANNCWFSMENWISRKYHTLILYPFSYTGPSWLTVLFTLHIVPSTGLSSFWFAYFCGSIGGGLGKVTEYYYSFYMLHKNRKERKKKYNFEDIATKQMQLAMSHNEYNAEEEIEKQSYNPHDYIDDKLLNKLYYASNAKEAYIGPQQAINGLFGYSLALSGHYLYRELRKYVKHRINDMESNDDEKENIKYDKGKVVIWLNVYHSFVFAVSSYNLIVASVAYIRQIHEKQNDPGGYGHMSSGRGRYGVDLGTLSAFFCGIMAYPFVINVKKIWKWNGKLSMRHKYDNKNDSK